MRFISATIMLVVCALFSWNTVNAQMQINRNTTLQYAVPAPQSQGQQPSGQQQWSPQATGNVIALVRPDGAGENEFAIRFTSPHAISGCAGTGTYETGSVPHYHILEIYIGPLIMNPNDPDGANCVQNPQTPFTDFILNRDELIAGRVTIIDLFSGYDRNRFTLDINKNRVYLFGDHTTKSRVSLFRPQTVPTRKNTLLKWFYPGNSYILWLPGRPYNMTDREKLVRFAENRGLQPMEKALPGFESPLTDQRFIYVVDRTDSLNNIAGLENGAQIGHVLEQRQQYGLETTQIMNTQIPVFAKKPGPHE